VRFVAWTEAGVLVASSSDGKVRLWNPVATAPLAVLDAGRSGAPAIAIDPAHRRLVVALGRKVRLWDLGGARWIDSLPDRAASVERLAVSPDGSRIAAALAGNLFEVWESATGDVLLRLPGSSSAWSAAWPRADLLALVPLDGTIRVLRAPDPR
jgi:WD40 repeat protein